MTGRVLVTGATGFIGRELCRDLLDCEYKVTAAVRRIKNDADIPATIEQREVGKIGPRTRWNTILDGVTTIIHLVSEAELPSAPSQSLLDRYRIVNVEGTRSLEIAAAARDVQRIIFMSTIKVNGEITLTDVPFSENHPPQPQNAYAQSKWEAEQLLLSACRSSSVGLTVLRPPIVYGPHGSGNFLALMRLVDRGWPLPLASIQNKRSLIYVKNLTSAVIACLKAPQAAGKTYLVSDGTDVSTPEWIRTIASASGKRARLFPFPPKLLNLGGSLMGKSDISRRLTASLQIDSSQIRNELSWHPPFTLTEAFEATVRWYHSQTRA